MKEYPSIARQVQDVPIYAFDKMDGSNIRAEWNRKTGFSKFGSRTQLIDKSHPFLGEAPGKIIEKYGEALNAIFKKERFERVTCFFEFFGASSFAGRHFEEPHDVVLFDINVFKKGIMRPGDFLKMFGHLHIPKMVYFGKANQIFVDDIRNARLSDVTFEGVVCKSNETDKYGHPIMFKVKSDQWLSKLKEFCGEDEKLFRSLE